MQLRIDPTLRPPGPTWMMFEGDHAGYELHWLPEQFILQVMRAPDVLLGSVRLRRLPTEVVFTRRGLRLYVRVDGDEVLSCLDPGGTAPLPKTWGFYVNGAMGHSDIGLHDDRDLLDAVERQALEWTTAPTSAPARWRERPLLMTRSALLAEREHAGVALALATSTVDAASHQRDGRDALRTWLEWDYLRLALMPSTTTAAESWPELDVPTAKEQLETLARLHPSPEQPGLFLALMDHLAAQAVAHPVARNPEEALATRQAWLTLTREVAASVLRLDAWNNGILPDEWRWQVRLLHHAATCLGGGTPDSLPAEAPPWAMLRWHMLAGGRISGDALTRPENQIPAIEWDGNPIRPALDRLLAAAETEPLAATEATAQITIEVEKFSQRIGSLLVSQQIELRTQMDKTIADLIRKPVPEREAALIQALLALHGIGSADKAHERLYPKDARTRRLPDDPPLALAERDPLAYALDRLLVTRIIYAASAGGDDQQRASSSDDLLRNPTGLPPSLVNYTRLLSGQSDALERAWDFPGLSPVQALTAAIALNEAVCNVQEANLALQVRRNQGELDTIEAEHRRQELERQLARQRAEIDRMWRLLDRLPCLTLPLRFAQPAPRAARPDNVEGGPAHPLSVP
jgi:hypothetical protein